MKQLINHQKAQNRKEAISQGAYDGRFSPKVFKDKKKESKKYPKNTSLAHLGRASFLQSEG